MQRARKQVSFVGLAVFASSNVVLGVRYGRRPIETSSKGFADQCSRCAMVAPSTSMDLFEYLLAFFDGDALLK
jgi:hypothetical protein